MFITALYHKSLLTLKLRSDLHGDRHRRLRYVNKGVGRRKVGRDKARDIKEKRNRELQGTRGYVVVVYTTSEFRLLTFYKHLPLFYRNQVV